MARYKCGAKIVMGEYLWLRNWALRELSEGMSWFAAEFKYQERETMRADDDGMQ